MYMYQLVLTLQAKPSLIKTDHPLLLTLVGEGKEKGGGVIRLDKTVYQICCLPRAQSKIYTNMTLLLLEFLIL